MATATTSRRRTNGAAATKTPLLQPPAGVEIWESPLVPGVQHWVELVDPERAKFLKTLVRERQRGKSDDTGDKYAADMKTDSWIYTADALKFSPDEKSGDDINDDGQHRFDAVIKSGKPQPFLIVRNLSPDAITVMDAGRGRTFSDRLRIEGVPDHSAAAALTKKVWHWQHDNYGDRGVLRVKQEGRRGLYQYALPSNPQMWATYQSMPGELITCAKHGKIQSRPFKGNIGPSILGFVWLYTGRIDVDLREKFFFALAEGNGATNPADPIRRFRHRFTQKRLEGEKRLRDWLQLHYMVQTWNAWINEEDLNFRRPTPVVPRNMAQFEDPFSDLRDEGWQPL